MLRQRSNQCRMATLAALAALAACSVIGCDKIREKIGKPEATDSEHGKGKGKGSGEGRGGKKEVGGKGRGGRDSGPIAVRVETAKFEQAPRSVSVTAVLDGRSQAEVYSKVTGRLSYIGPKEGEAVKTGTVLFRVDRNDPGETFLNTPVVSPINGWIGRWMIKNIGAQITTTTPVVTVVDDDFLWTTIFLSTSEWLAIDEQAVVQVTVGEEKRSGKVVSIARAADSISGRGSAVIEVENKEHKWRVGMIARIKIDLEPKMRMLVSSAAVNITDQGSYVFVIEEGIAKKTPVKFALVDSDTVEILEGIKDQSTVVVAGANYLTDKVQVKIVESEHPEKAH